MGLFYFGDFKISIADDFYLRYSFNLFFYIHLSIRLFNINVH